MALAYRSKVSGVVQIDGMPVQRTVRAFGYDPTGYLLDGENVNLSKPLGHAVSDPTTGEYEIELLGGYSNPVFVVAFDDYGVAFSPEIHVNVGDRVHPSTPNGYVWECVGAGTLPGAEPDWISDTETSHMYGTASMIARPFYRPMVHGPVTPQVDLVPGASKAMMWRVRVISNNGGTNTHIALLDFITENGAGSHNMPITPISGDSSGTADLAFVGDVSASSRWVTYDQEPYIGCAFESEVRVVSVRIYPSDDPALLSELPANFVIESSNDGVIWTEETQITGQTSWTAGEPSGFYFWIFHS